MDQTGSAPSGKGPHPPPGGPPTTSTTTSTTTSASSGESAWRTWLPALAFVAGAALTAAVFLIGGSGGDGAGTSAPRGEAPVSAQPSPLPRATDPALLVRVPAACVEAAEFTETVTSSLGELAGAARDFDARRLQETLDALQQLRPEVQAASRQCRDLAAEGEIVTAPTPTPAGAAVEPAATSEPAQAPSVSGSPTPAS